jgi:iron(III) transport system ATP-binding protein
MSVAGSPSTKVDNGRWGPRGTAAATFAGRLGFENVSLSFGKTEVLRDVSFELSPGEIVCLLGPSGCGKTTLLRIAAGIERPQAGRVLIDGLEMVGPKTFVPPERRGVGLMFQDFALFPHLTILDNVAFGLRDLKRTDALAEAEKALSRVGLARYAAVYPHALSGGEQQRVALARAIVPRPQVMLMDEPFSGLDQRLRESVRNETLALLKETRATSMIVTHDSGEAMALADRILLMRQGRLIQTGTPLELYQHPVDAAAARFFSDMNEVTGAVSNGCANTPLGSFPAPRCVAGESALVLIRPQAFELARNGVGVEGFVLASHYLGDVTLSTVLFKGIEDPLTVRTAARDAPRQGKSEQFSVDPAQVFIFPKPAGDPN